VRGAWCKQLTVLGAAYSDQSSMTVRSVNSGAPSNISIIVVLASESSSWRRESLSALPSFFLALEDNEHDHPVRVLRVPGCRRVNEARTRSFGCLQLSGKCGEFTFLYPASKRDVIICAHISATFRCW